ncbi:hypothetical protein CGC21_8105 [Leishmania donovani]|uniref:Uncharacterized protein n=1 Tax=Leishmania donovani TaxID=5661 RepID=A0A504XAE1_LEIDO|nr:hypothetical protein CGC21_8105 [Leishmania donovani]
MHGRRALLSIRNQSVAAGRVPAICKEGLIVPLQEQHRPNDNTAPYLPVTLTSNLCKLLKRPTSRRVQDHLEGRLQPPQSGFHPHYSTRVDSLGMGLRKTGELHYAFCADELTLLTPSSGENVIQVTLRFALWRAEHRPLKRFMVLNLQPMRDTGRHVAGAIKVARARLARRRAVCSRERGPSEGLLCPFGVALLAPRLLCGAAARRDGASANGRTAVDTTFVPKAAAATTAETRLSPAPAARRTCEVGAA